MGPGGRDHWLVAMYRRMTALYPAPFRDEYETEMVEAARDRTSEPRGVTAALWLAAELIADVFTTAPREHREHVQTGPPARRTRCSEHPGFDCNGHLGGRTRHRLGIGSASAVFTIVNAILLRPFPFANPESLGAIVENSAVQKVDRMGPSLPDLYDLRDQSRLIESVATATRAASPSPDRASNDADAVSMTAAQGVFLKEMVGSR